jgi:heterodisulfide reductase subunit A
MSENGGAIRIGVYTCHCGANIAAVVDMEALTSYGATLPNVAVSRDCKYLCSDPGQDLIRQDIAERRLNRVVVAACSPQLHERTFRAAVAAAGLNPFCLQMANIREHVSWVHEDKEEATRKSRDLLRAAVRRVARHAPLEPERIPIHPATLVVGGGIAGIHAALTLARAGKPVYLVEREPTIGGHMAKFDRTFPTLDCAACILTPKMSAVKNHPNITLWTYSDVTQVDGYAGNYKVKVTRWPRYVREDLCVGCMECLDACVYKDARVLDDFNLGLAKRKPIYLPFPQAVPQVPVIDPESCIQFKSGRCKKPCVDACGERHAISFQQQEQIEEIEVGNIIVATGFQTFDVRRTPYYGYGAYPNVYTALEVERLVNASGPTGGEIVLRDGRTPKTVGIVHCVGSRDENTNRWCSRVCCMYSLKLAHLIKERTGADVFNFYIDIRTPGKDFEEFYQKLLNERVHFVRGRVAEITDWALDPTEDGKLVIRVEDTLAGLVRRIPVDMVVLSTGLEPRADSQDVRRLFHIGCSDGGFFRERHPKLDPVSTFTDGVFIAGCCQGPKDIPDTVAQAGAAAAEALASIDSGYFETEPNAAYVIEEACSGCRTCIPLCAYNAIEFMEATGKARINRATCKGCGTCVAACPSGSIRQNLFEDEQIFEEIEGILANA